MCRLIMATLFTLTILLTGLAGADMTRYRDPATGRWVLTNREPPSGATDVHTSSSTTPAPHVAPPPRVLAPPPPPAVVTVPAPPAEAPPSAARPIDTHQFGLLRPGMTMLEVRSRVGPPAVVVDLGRQVHGRRTPAGSRLLTEVVVEAWDYPGSGRTLPVRVIFHNGILAAKYKERR